MSTFGLTNTFSNPNPKIVNSLDISNCKLFNGNCRVKFRVCAKVTSPEPNAKVYGQFSAPVKPSSSSSTASSSSPKKKKEDEEKQDYYLNMGYAIRCLREEFPELFCKELSFDIYRYFSLIVSMFSTDGKICLNTTNYGADAPSTTNFD